MHHAEKLMYNPNPKLVWDLNTYKDLGVKCFIESSQFYHVNYKTMVHLFSLIPATESLDGL